MVEEGVTTIENMSVVDFKQILGEIDNKILIIKFSAGWCKPCQKIKPFVEYAFTTLPQNVITIENDIDETMDLYASLKRKKMVKGVPTILAYYGDTQRIDDQWYVSDASVSGCDENNVGAFFQECIEKANALL